MACQVISIIRYVGCVDGSHNDDNGDDDDHGDGDGDGDGLPAYSHHDKIPPWWGN